MLSLCLTFEELREITGKIRASAQIRYLRAQGIAFIVRADGRPVVSRNHFEAVMSGKGSTSKKPEAEPDFSCFR